MSLETIEAVSNELTKRGYEATFNYPGFIDVVIDGATISFGTTNDNWDGDVETAIDAGVLNTSVPSTCEDVTRIADALAEQIELCKHTHPELSYAARQIFGAVTDAMEPAEGMYFDTDEYVPLMQAIITEATQRIANFKAWNVKGETK